MWTWEDACTSVSVRMQFIVMICFIHRWIFAKEKFPALIWIYTHRKTYSALIGCWAHKWFSTMSSIFLWVAYNAYARKHQFIKKTSQTFQQCINCVRSWGKFYYNGILCVLCLPKNFNWFRLIGYDHRHTYKSSETVSTYRVSWSQRVKIKRNHLKSKVIRKRNVCNGKWELKTALS